MKRPAQATATACAVLLAGLACKEITGEAGADPGGGDLPPGGDLSDTVTVVIENFAFRTPNGTDSITIAEGQVVRFVNRDAAPHTATSTQAPAGAPGLDSGRLDQGDTYHWAPPSTGEWTYRCDFHPADMSGAVIRVGAAMISGGMTPARCAVGPTLVTARACSVARFSPRESSGAASSSAALTVGPPKTAPKSGPEALKLCIASFPSIEATTSSIEAADASGSTLPLGPVAPSSSHAVTASIRAVRPTSGRHQIGFLVCILLVLMVYLPVLASVAERMF